MNVKKTFLKKRTFLVLFSILLFLIHFPFSHFFKKISSFFFLFLYLSFNSFFLKDCFLCLFLDTRNLPLFFFSFPLTLLDLFTWQASLWKYFSPFHSFIRTINISPQLLITSTICKIVYKKRRNYTREINLLSRRHSLQFTYSHFSKPHYRKMALDTIFAGSTRGDTSEFGTLSFIFLNFLQNLPNFIILRYLNNYDKI